MKSYDQIQNLLDDPRAIRILSEQCHDLSEEIKVEEEKVLDIDGKLALIDKELHSLTEDGPDDFEFFSPISNSSTRKNQLEKLTSDRTSLVSEKESIALFTQQKKTKLETLTYILSYIKGLMEGIDLMKEEYDRLAESMFEESVGSTERRAVEIEAEAKSEIVPEAAPESDPVSVITDYSTDAESEVNDIPSSPEISSSPSECSASDEIISKTDDSIDDITPSYSTAPGIYMTKIRLQLCHDLALSDPYRVRTELKDIISKL